MIKKLLNKIRTRRIEKVRKKIEEQSNLYKLGKLEGVSFTSTRLYKFKLENQEMLDKMQQKSKSMSSEERREFFANRYKNIVLRSCPLCNNQAALSIFLKKYRQTEGFAGGYDINAKIECKNCTCGLDTKLLYTNITFGNETFTEADVDETVALYVKRWNERYNDEDAIKACRSLHGDTSNLVMKDEQRY